jgi:hypothetical protein
MPSLVVGYVHGRCGRACPLLTKRRPSSAVGRHEVRNDFVTEDARMVWARAIPATECSRRAAPNDLERPCNFKEDVKIMRTNSTSPLESPWISRRQTQNGAKSKPKNALRICKRLQITRIVKSSATAPLPIIPNRQHVFVYPLPPRAS